MSELIIYYFNLCKIKNDGSTNQDYVNKFIARIKAFLVQQ